jgi:hypothetical protein
MPRGYAAETSVPVERSKAEIEEILVRYGAEQFVSGWTAVGATIGFVMKARCFKFELAYPARGDSRFTMRTVRGHKVRANETWAQKAYDQEIRRLWRALLLVIKAKMEAVRSGIGSLEQEFMANIVVPGTANQTMADVLLPQLAELYQRGKMPTLMLGYSEKREDVEVIPLPDREAR